MSEGCSEAHLEVLCHQPGLEGRVQQGGSNAAEQASDQQHDEHVPVLGRAADAVGDDIRQCCLLPPSASMQSFRRPRLQSHHGSGRCCTLKDILHSQQLPACPLSYTLLLELGRCLSLLLSAASHMTCMTHGRTQEGTRDAVEESAHVLSARDPTIVPKTAEDPKPAMNRRPMSPLSKP